MAITTLLHLRRSSIHLLAARNRFAELLTPVISATNTAGATMVAIDTTADAPSPTMVANHTRGANICASAIASLLWNGRTNAITGDLGAGSGEIFIDGYWAVKGVLVLAVSLCAFLQGLRG